MRGKGEKSTHFSEMFKNPKVEDRLLLILQIVNSVY